MGIETTLALALGLPSFSLSLQRDHKTERSFLALFKNRLAHTLSLNRLLYGRRIINDSSAFATNYYNNWFRFTKIAIVNCARFTHLHFCILYRFFAQRFLLPLLLILLLLLRTWFLHSTINKNCTLALLVHALFSWCWAALVGGVGRFGWLY